MTRGRKTTETTLPEAPQAEEAALRHDLNAVDALAAFEAGYSDDRDLLNQLLGQAQMANAFAQFSLTVSTSKIAFVKENKLYRALSGKKAADGRQFTGSWEDFCLLLGRSRQQVDEDILNLKTLGEEALESMSRMGIGYREMRQYRRLPEDQKGALIEAAKIGDKDSFLELAEDLIAKHAAEKAAKDIEIEGLKADREADARLLATRTDKLNDLERHVAKLETGTIPLAERIEPVMDEVAEFSKRLDLDMRNLAVIFAAVEEIAGAEAEKPQDEADMEGVLPLVQRLRDAINRAATASARLQFEFEGRLQHYIGAAEMFLAHDAGQQD